MPVSVSNPPRQCRGLHGDRGVPLTGLVLSAHPRAPRRAPAQAAGRAPLQAEAPLGQQMRNPAKRSMNIHEKNAPAGEGLQNAAPQDTHGRDAATSTLGSRLLGTRFSSIPERGPQKRPGQHAEPCLGAQCTENRVLRSIRAPPAQTSRSTSPPRPAHPARGRSRPLRGGRSPGTPHPAVRGAPHPQRPTPASDSSSARLRGTRGSGRGGDPQAPEARRPQQGPGAPPYRLRVPVPPLRKRGVAEGPGSLASSGRVPGRGRRRSRLDGGARSEERVGALPPPPSPLSLLPPPLQPLHFSRAPPPLPAQRPPPARAPAPPGADPARPALSPPLPCPALRSLPSPPLRPPPPSPPLLHPPPHLPSSPRPPSGSPPPQLPAIPASPARSDLARCAAPHPLPPILVPPLPSSPIYVSHTPPASPSFPPSLPLSRLFAMVG
ncbi:uncharacterized protein LOC101788196 [Cavia porcellus]|uniref:uncharacterized protein LOC101788196 n=1 Tax=Cavia porcellus TaxID=10141 RepID=UPI002FE2BD3E